MPLATWNLYCTQAIPAGYCYILVVVADYENSPV